MLVIKLITTQKSSLPRKRVYKLKLMLFA